jgi:RNA polymerase sigma factor (sigma-70 family)
MSRSPVPDETGAGAGGSVGAAALIETLSRRFRVPLLRFFEKRIGRHGETEDLVQEVFVRLAGSGRVESIERLESYLFTTAANLLRDRQRRLAARASEAHESYDEETHGSARETHSPERALLGAQAIQQLVAALYELPERTRTVWILYHLQDLSHAEIAHQLRIAVSTIEKHLGRASVHLLKCIDRPT